MSDFVRANDVYRRLREILSPVLQRAGYQRVPKSKSAWSRPQSDGALTITFRTSSFGRAATGGNMLDAEVLLRDGTGATTRRTELSRCLLQPELDELREVQAEVNARRPVTSVTVQWLPEDSLVAASTRSSYEPPGPARYQQGRYVGFDYYSDEDVRAFAAFLARHGPAALERFAADLCPPPVYVPLPSGTFGIVPPAG